MKMKIDFNNDHNHAAPTHILIESMRIKKRMKDGAIGSRDNTVNVVRRQTSNLSTELIVNLPKEDSLKRSVQRIRAAEIPDYVPSIPEIPETLWYNTRDELFLRKDSGIEEVNRHVIFASDFQMCILEKAKIWVMDGTFKSVPLHFSQLVTIMGNYLGKFWICGHALLVNKTEDSYRLLFSELKKMKNFNSDEIIVDFEKGLYNSVRSSFISANVNGCNFHFGQMIWRKVQNENLSICYKENQWQKEFIRRCFHLAFIPPELVQIKFEKIVLEASNRQDERLTSFLNYFKKMFIRGETTENPMYDINFWSCYRRVLKDVPRTTNVLEGWHRALNASFNTAHPNLAALIQVISAEEQSIHFSVTQIKGGVNYNITGRDFKKEASIKCLLTDFQEYDFDVFVKLINRLMTFKTS